MIDIIVVTHGEFGAYLVEAAEEIVGSQPEGVRCVGISSRQTVAQVRQRLERALRETGPGGVVVAVDMPGGTPCNVAMPLVKDRPDARVVSGVNLYMLVTAFNRRRSAGLDELADAMIEAGRRAIVDVKSLFLSRAC